jgi:hypothetical protein
MTQEKLIKRHEVVGMVYMETIKRQGCFGFRDVLTDTKDIEFISTCISEKIDNQYFDKYGNSFTIDEIE